MSETKEREKKWCIFAHGLSDGQQIRFYEKIMGMSISAAWEEFRKKYCGVTFTHIFISEVT